MKVTVPKVFYIFLFLLIISCTYVSNVKADDGGESPFVVLQSKYERLSNRGKFAAGCTVGFVGSRIAVNTLMKCVKIGAAAYVT